MPPPRRRSVFDKASLNEAPPPIVAFSDVFHRRVDDITHLSWADLGRIQQAAFILATSDEEEGTSDVGDFFVGYRHWTPLSVRVPRLPFGAIVLTLVRDDEAGAIIVATYCLDPRRRYSWCCHHQHEEHRSKVGDAAAIRRACHFLGVLPPE